MTDVTLVYRPECITAADHGGLHVQVRVASTGAVVDVGCLSAFLPAALLFDTWRLTAHAATAGLAALNVDLAALVRAHPACADEQALAQLLPLGDLCPCLSRPAVDADRRR